MPDTTLLLNGFSIIGNPHTNSNAAQGGNLLIHDGESVFDDDDIIAFTVSNATIDGVLTDDSVITGIVVYDNATEYYNEIPKFTYSGAADIDFGRNTMGDRYLEFDASGLTSPDAGAPALDDMAVVAGVNILATLQNSNGPFVVPTIEDIDIDGDGVISPDEESDGSFTSELNALASICFAKGTLIETPKGPRYVETLAIDDLVNTLDQGGQPIRWIGAQKVAGTGKNAPVHIAAGAIGNIRELVVSQNHRMLMSGPKAELLFGQSEVLIAAKHLANDSTIRIRPCENIQYYHFLFDEHQIVFAEGCPAESLYPGAQTLENVGCDSRDEIIRLFPQLAEQNGTHQLSRYVLQKFEAAALTRVA